MSGIRGKKIDCSTNSAMLTALGDFVLSAKRIYQAHPDTKDDLMRLAKRYADLYSAYTSRKSNDSVDQMPLSEAMIKRIFEEI